MMKMHQNYNPTMVKVFYSNCSRKKKVRNLLYYLITIIKKKITNHIKKSF